jgi:hypothetical protein
MTAQTHATPQYGPPTDGPLPGGMPPAPRTRTGVVVGSILAAVLVLGGLVVGAVVLFGTTTLDTAEAERQISRLTQDQAGVAPADVSCPADVEASAGTTFTCAATLEDQPISFTVTQTDAEGNVQIDSDNTFVDVAVVEASLAEQFGAMAEVEVVSTCDTDGRTVLVDGIGTPIGCTVANAQDASDSVAVTATVDATGAVSYQLQ